MNLEWQRFPPLSGSIWLQGHHVRSTLTAKQWKEHCSLSNRPTGGVAVLYLIMIGCILNGGVENDMSAFPMQIFFWGCSGPYFPADEEGQLPEVLTIRPIQASVGYCHKPQPQEEVSPTNNCQSTAVWPKNGVIMYPYVIMPLWFLCYRFFAFGSKKKSPVPSPSPKPKRRGSAGGVMQNEKLVTNSLSQHSYSTGNLQDLDLHADKSNKSSPMGWGTQAFLVDSLGPQIP